MMTLTDQRRTGHEYGVKMRRKAVRIPADPKLMLTAVKDLAQEQLGAEWQLGYKRYRISRWWKAKDQAELSALYFDVLYPRSVEPTLRAGEYMNRATLLHHGPELYPRQSGFHFQGSYRNLYDWGDPYGITFLVAGRDPLCERTGHLGNLFCTGELMLLAPLYRRSETLRIHGVYKTVPAGRTFVPETYRLDEIRKGR